MVEGQLAARGTAAAVLAGVAVADVDALAREPDDVLLRAIGAEQAHDGGRRVLARDGADRSLVVGDGLDLAQKAHADRPLPGDDPERLIALIEQKGVYGLHDNNYEGSKCAGTLARGFWLAREDWVLSSARRVCVKLRDRGPPGSPLAASC